jgi:dienelactone hydrolase
MLKLMHLQLKHQASNKEASFSATIAIPILLTIFIMGIAFPCYGVEQSQIDPSRADAMLAEYFKAETAKLRDRCLTDINSLEDWQAKRKIYREQLFEMVGLSPLPEKTDLKPVITGKIEHEQFTVENLQFQSMPGLYVTANLYIPKGLEKPAPAILYVCGHGNVKKNGISYGSKTAYQHHPAWFARNGYVCLIIDTLQLGEIEGIHHGTYRYQMWWWNSRGYTPAGVEAWNCIRALDYLETRKEVDASRFGVTGRSGGGAYSWWISALDERIKAAVPVAGITDLQNYVVNGCVEGHCDCMFIVNTYRWDYPLIAALVAPRPLLISNSDKDSLFPLDGVVRLHEKVSNIYHLYGADKNLGLNITEGPHKDTQELRVHAFVWFNRFLKNDSSLIDKVAIPFFEPEQLKVFKELPADQINTKIHESFVPQNQQPIDNPTQQQALLKTLREKSFGGWPTHEQAGPLNIKKVFSTERQGIRLSAFDFTSQPYVRLRLYLVQNSAQPQKVVLNVLDDKEFKQWLAGMRFGFADELKDETLPDPNEVAFNQFVEMLKDNKSAFAFTAPRGIGLTAWNPDERKQTQIRRRFMLLGQTLDGMRVWDVRRAIQTMHQIESLNDVPVVLKGQHIMAGIVLYALLFEPDIAGLDLQYLPNSHRDGPIFLNVLRFMDIPQAVAIAAERTQSLP